MDFKLLWKDTIIGFILKRVLLAALLVLAFAWGTLLVLDHYTRLGEAVPVPDLRGLYEEEAARILRSQDLFIQVIDSVYDKNKALGTIIEQIPGAGSSVKKHRSIFLILNKRQSKTIPMPEVSDISYRQADALLRSLGLRVGYVQYRPSEFKDLVIDVHYNGEHLEPGTRLPEGAAVVLVVGSGYGDATATVPFLLGTSVASARTGAVASSFIVGSVNYDEPPLGDEELYRVYRQEPSSGEQMAEGTRINIWLTKDTYLIEEALKQGSKQTEEEEEAFF